EKLARHLDANRMRAEIEIARVAAAVAEEAGARVLAAHLERLAVDVDRWMHLHGGRLTESRSHTFTQILPSPRAPCHACEDRPTRTRRCRRSELRTLSLSPPRL